MDHTEKWPAFIVRNRHSANVWWVNVSDRRVTERLNTKVCWVRTAWFENRCAHLGEICCLSFCYSILKIEATFTTTKLQHQSINTTHNRAFTFAFQIHSINSTRSLEITTPSPRYRIVNSTQPRRKVSKEKKQTIPPTPPHKQTIPPPPSPQTFRQSIYWTHIHRYRVRQKPTNPQENATLQANNH